MSAISLQWLLMMITLIAITIAITVGLRNASHDARDDMFVDLAIGFILSPGLFLLAPRSWIDSPRAMLLTWWILPVGISCVSVGCIGDMGAMDHILTAFSVPVAGFWAMFAPVIVVGMRAAGKQKQQPRN